MEKLIEALSTKGIEVETIEVVKNGVVKTGLRLSGKTVTPVIYPDMIMQDCKRIEEAAEKIKSIFDEAENHDNIFKVDNLTDKDFILKNCFIALQRVSSEDIVKRETVYEGIEQYLIIQASDQATCKVKPELLKIAGIRETEIWQAARENTKRNITIKPINEIIDLPFDIPMHIISNKTSIKGSGSLLINEEIERYMQEKGIEEAYILPSSIHEVILIEAIGTIEEMTGFVNAVNSSEVLPEDQLSDRAYIFR